jgi:hypothetical protein
MSRNYRGTPQAFTQNHAERRGAIICGNRCPSFIREEFRSCQEGDSLRKATQITRRHRDSNLRANISAARSRASQQNLTRGFTIKMHDFDSTPHSYRAARNHQVSKPSLPEFFMRCRYHKAKIEAFILSRH